MRARPLTPPGPGPALAFAFAFAAAAPEPALAAPSWVRLSLLGDSTSIGVAWNTTSGPPEAVVEYGPVDGPLAERATGTTRLLGGPLGSVSEVVLAKLAPGTEYLYRAGGPRGGFSAVGRFRTGPAPAERCGRCRFAYVGDTRAEPWDGDLGTSANWPAVLLAIAAHRPAFVLHGGDIVCNARDLAQWRGHLRATAFASASLPIQYSLGNHDDGPGQGEGAVYNRLFLLPRASAADGGSGTEDYYFFTYGAVIVVSLSTETYASGRRPFAAQAAWLDRVLEQNPRPFKVVFLHRPLYTSPSIFGHRPNELGQREAFLPVFNRRHVDLVVQSHNHFYERFAPSACADPESPEVCPTSASRGTVYVTSGGGGAFPIFRAGASDVRRRAASGRHHFLLVDVAPGSLVLRAVEPSGGVLDTFVFQKPGAAAGCGGGSGEAER